MPLLPYYNNNQIEAGIDEAGRGCLFGRLYVAAVIWPENLDKEPPFEIKDSKKVTPKRRAVLRTFIEENALDYHVAYIENDVIDSINILQATMKGMHMALDGLKRKRPDYILVDGDRFIPYSDPDSKDLIPYQCIPSGDNTYLSIAAASILAKEYRDEYIIKLCNQNQDLNRYKLIKNKGYGTKEHRDAIDQFGITRYHRSTFGLCQKFSTKPVKIKKKNIYKSVKLGNIFLKMKERKDGGPVSQ